MPARGDNAYLFFDGKGRNKWLSAQKDAGLLPEKNSLRVLSEKGGFLEAAACLFEALHDLDRAGVSQIHAQLAPEASLGVAINDRLRRAAAKRG